MIKRTASRHEEVRPLGLGLFALTIIVVVGSTFAALYIFTKIALNAPAAEQWSASMEAIRNSFIVGAGAGGFAALLINLRRQRSTEISLIKTTHDATQRRNSELFSRSIEQLANESHAIRRGGLIALERLAQENPEFRQPVVDVICAYLRTAYLPPLAVLNHHGEKQDPRQQVGLQVSDKSDDFNIEEFELRQTMQEILYVHLRVADSRERDWYPIEKGQYPESFWASINVNLDRAILVSFTLEGCLVNTASFDRTIFLETTMFRNSVFLSEARFGGAKFGRDAWFDHSRFMHVSRFLEATFCHHASFSEVEFAVPALCNYITFEWGASFEKAIFKGEPYFGNSVFRHSANFENVKLLDQDEPLILYSPGGEWFRETRFDGSVKLPEISEADYADCLVHPDRISHVPHGWKLTTIDAVDKGEPSASFSRCE